MVSVGDGDTLKVPESAWCHRGHVARGLPRYKFLHQREHCFNIPMGEQCQMVAEQEILKKVTKQGISKLECHNLIEWSSIFVAIQFGRHYKLPVQACVPDVSCLLYDAEVKDVK